MSLRLITAPTEEPVTLAEVRAQCRIDDTAEDALLGTYIMAARQQCEALTGRALCAQTWEQVLDAFPAGAVRLLKAPVLSVESIKYTDADGAAQTLAPEAYAADLQADAAYVLPAYGLAWPATEASINALRIRYQAGYASAAAIPAPLKVWILATVATLYAQRESVDRAGRATPLPGRLIDGLLDDYRVYL